MSRPYLEIDKGQMSQVINPYLSGMVRELKLCKKTEWYCSVNRKGLVGGLNVCMRILLVSDDYYIALWGYHTIKTLFICFPINNWDRL